MLTFEALTLSILNIAIKQSRNSFLEANCCLFYNISCCPIFEPFPVLQQETKRVCLHNAGTAAAKNACFLWALFFPRSGRNTRGIQKMQPRYIWHCVRERGRNNGSENFSLLRLLLLAWKLSPFPKLSISGLECAKERPCVGMKES